MPAYGATDAVLYLYDVGTDTYTFNFLSTGDDTVTDGNDDVWGIGEAVTGSGGTLVGAGNYVGTITVDGVEYPLIDDGGGSFWVFFDDSADAALAPASFTGAQITMSPFTACFAGGTLIATPGGAVAVEDLNIGDLLMTAGGKAVPVKWMGWQDLFPSNVTLKMQPVRIRAGALGDNLPNEDLVLTGDHALLIDGHLINASALINGDTIDFLPLEECDFRLRVYHVETEHHDVILANGVTAETYLDIPGRAMFDNYQEYLDLYGAESIIREMNLPRITSQRLLPTELKARLGLTEPEMDFGEVLKSA